MLIFSFIFVSFVTIICIGKLYQVKHSIKDSSTHTHVIVMAVSMITSLTFGILLGLMFKQDLITSTIISTLIGLGIGYIVGRPFDQITSLAGLVEGVMGAMMGAMTGSMVHMAPNHLVFIMFVNLVFLVVCTSLFMVLHRFMKKSKEMKTKTVDIPTKSISL
ncbi:hypothetical protein [Aquibacillus sediminis]|uniref:hypothetical protein n=1 Tax=Aquibacillus sediminis TaxID=2574734 RepID=UPI0011080DB1|nr:hypothetical protein [Aquibacillus sediminis]